MKKRITKYSTIQQPIISNNNILEAIKWYNEEKLIITNKLTSRTDNPMSWVSRLKEIDNAITKLLEN